jgi:hypothetical protein
MFSEIVEHFAFAGLDITRPIRWISPNTFRKHPQAGNLKVIEFFDGSGGWELAPDGGDLIRSTVASSAGLSAKRH